MNVDKVKEFIKGYEESNIDTIRLAKELELEKFAVSLSKENTKVHNSIIFAIVKNIQEAGSDKEKSMHAIKTAEEILKLLPKETGEELQKNLDKIKEAEKKASSEEEVEQVWKFIEQFTNQLESIMKENPREDLEKKEIIPTDIDSKRQNSEPAHTETSSSAENVKFKYIDSEDKPAQERIPTEDDPHTMHTDNHVKPDKISKNTPDNPVEEFCNKIDEMIFSSSEIQKLRNKEGTNAKESLRQMQQMMEEEREFITNMLSKADNELIKKLKIKGVEKLDSTIDELNEDLSKLKRNSSLTDEEQEKRNQITNKMKRLNELRRFIDKY